LHKNMNPGRYQFHITPSAGKPWILTIEKSLIRIGRSGDCDLTLEDNAVSREHCCVTFTSDSLILEDCNSFNGTFVNDQRITRTLLKPRDKIRVGFSEILLILVPEKEQTEPHKIAKGPPQEPILIPLVPPNEPQPNILVTHPDCSSIENLITPLKDCGAIIETAASSDAVNTILAEKHPDCIILDAQIPDVLGLCREVRSQNKAGPIIILAQETSRPEIIALLKTGADDVLMHNDGGELLIRVRSMLELNRLRQKEHIPPTGPVDQEADDKLKEAERFKRLKKYLSPQIVSAVMSAEQSRILKPTRREITVVFSDLRNYTRFSETSEPEEVIAMLNDFHVGFGEIILEYNGTLEHFAGDAIMVFFGAPTPSEDHARRAVAMVVEARKRLKELTAKWQKLGYTLDIAFGISTGYVFVGTIGFEGRMDYAAIGNTTNLASRLCSAAKGGQILISRKTLFYVEDMVEVEEIGALEVKGFSEPVMAYNVLGLKPDCQPCFS
jgi:class 3 adenylate cyclase/CheY-like chemotaxis protein